ncbi:MAG: hypothetical protein A3C70_02790 [Candidatus Zambryskibacteria bacterium RIFCSPHIGHO2_02_FULL_43_14]|uniref:DUF8128 domain-containing protein n=1 Tax=Candidatus Zambryskibacteria bacterium RIFCSPHIGHO2_02_FULL_43_14 TaxID=1802748 RepID=A0A1G2TGF5_9BACT|nr:MAG: hypothetical protein A2829_01295 [Candidatus Zambryskibacteria bacterium RIFCSPHIGHO2_01_FULL_43_60]OHA96118.1 MAG: hypothetical protein A3C70_02790 [Candidatus Zambryskibacteria bacterium RIFCSPHIGHO2_02_FULL_43_14]OHB03482.1 MAG: hypothetical protein A3B03_00425 [Candidatus Zambryskibacteria bacterium RIFCSPLOWO2_01_FULL_42_41]
MIENFISLFQADFYEKAWGYITTTWPIWLPLFMVTLFFNIWLSYKRREWIRSQGSVLLEIKLPRIIDKSPAAMEMVLEGLWEDIVGTLTDVFIEGRVRDFFSLEIVSIGGEVKFFIWALSKWKNIIESRIYAQYPGAEVFEAEDYALKMVYDPEKAKVFGITTRLVKPDAYPIKTYIDYELDKGNKEQEEIVDPIVPVLEYLGSLKPGELAGIQILIQGHRKEGLQDAHLFSKPDWQEGIKKEMKKIIEKDSLVTPKPDKPLLIPYLTKTQDDTIKAIERNAGKLAFNSMVRVAYIAPIDIFDKTRGAGIIGSMRQFGSKNLNGIRPHVFMSTDYPWTDFNKIIENRLKRTHIDAYKRRSFFDVPYKNLNGKPYVLTVEELATIFHFPGAVATTPTLTRVPSKKAQAPANLPV